MLAIKSLSQKFSVKLSYARLKNSVQFSSGYLKQSGIFDVLKDSSFKFIFSNITKLSALIHVTCQSHRLQPSHEVVHKYNILQVGKL